MPDIRFEHIVGEIETAGRKAKEDRAKTRPTEARKIEERLRQMLAAEAWRAERLSAD
jgi:hypothetical protein